MRFYLDTSVFFGLFDKQFQKHTRNLFDFIEKQGIKIIHSDVLQMS
jgi:predicted nucleic acid-binding protein